MNELVPSHVLVVEDDPAARENLRDILELDHYDVDTADSIADSLRDRDWSSLLAILLDRRLPDGTADDLLPELKKLAPGAAVIVITGYADIESAVSALRHGATDYLLKPIEPEALRATLGRVAESRRAEGLFEMAIEAAPSSMLMVDEEGRITFANSPSYSMFGYEPGELEGRSIDILVPDRMRAAHAGHRARYLQQPQARRMGEGRDLVGRRKDGSEFPAEIGLNPMRMQSGTFVLAAVADITLRKQAEALRELEVQLNLARAIQQNLFPDSAPALAGFDIAGATFPAEATGGDYYDFIPLMDGTLGLVVGDVSGHGVGPAMLMAVTRAYLRALTRTSSEAGELLTRANRLLVEDTRSQHFVTVFFGQLDPRTRTLAYAAAGHLGYHLDAAGTATRITSTGLILGAVPDAVIASGDSRILHPGEIVLLMTDGVVETRRADGTLFGADRTLAVVRDHQHEPAHKIVEALYRAARDFGGEQPQQDDITAVVIKVDQV